MPVINNGQQCPMAIAMCYYPCTDIFENQNSHKISFGFIVLGKLSSEYSNLLVKLSQITKKKSMSLY